MEGGEAGRGEGVCVEGHEGVFGGYGAEGVVEGEEAGEVVEVGDEGCPDWELEVSWSLLELRERVANLCLSQLRASCLTCWRKFDYCRE